MKKNIQTSGKRKTAKARATLKNGTGIIRINNIILDDFQPKIAREKIREAIILANSPKDINVDITTLGGGIMGSADAARTALAKALVENSAGLKKVFLEYDRTLLVADVRIKERAKPNRHGKARSKTQKSYR